MRVAELRDLLATLPDDMLVDVNGGHLVAVSKLGASTHQGYETVWHHCPDCGGRHWCLRDTGPRTIPARLHLLGASYYGGRNTDLVDPEPPVLYSGRWARASRAVIDHYSDDPDA